MTKESDKKFERFYESGLDNGKVVTIESKHKCNGIEPK